MTDCETYKKDPWLLKKWIVGLLGVSVVLTLILFSTYSPPDNSRFRTAAEIDSLLYINFDRFNILDSQIRSRTVQIDSVTSRIVYTVRVPPGFSKSQWHYELDRLVRPYRAETPAKILFPDRDMRIYITSGTNIVRTVLLQTDPELIIYRDFTSIVLLFNRPPPEETLQQIRSFGEPIQLAIRSNSPRSDYDVIRNLRRNYSHTVWLLKENNGDNYDDLSKMDNFLTRLSLVNQVDSGAGILFHNPYPEISDSFKQRLSRMNLRLIDVSEAIRIDDITDPQQVSQIKRKLVERSSIYRPPILMIEGSGSTIRNLQEFITNLKQDHIQIRSSPIMEF